MKKYIAHSLNVATNLFHYLNDHLKKTAQISSSFARNNCEDQILKYMGYTHDLGKYRDGFQKYLLGGGIRGSEPHSIYGAYLAYIRKVPIASICIAGHHAGIPDSTDLSPRLRDEDVKKQTEELFNILLQDLGINFNNIDLTNSCVDENIKAKLKDKLTLETYIRFFFSCLVDADWLDTESHFNPDVSQSRISKPLDINKMIDLLDKHISKFSVDGEINQLRNNARVYANNLANKPVGFYSLNLPTGLGKTLCSVSWALRHAKTNNLKRIIIVLPYTSIIDQSAKLLKDIFGESEILEHHSNFEYTGNDEVNYDIMKLSAENWDFPLIITTTVQFFESVFSNKPSKCRKVHNIADSVVIFDEVQTLPKDKFLPTITMIKNLKDVFNTSFLFCTATQPAFASRKEFKGIDEIISLVDNPSQFFIKTKRVDYDYVNGLEGIGFNELIKKINDMNESALVVFNLKKDTLNLFNQIQGNWNAKYHLSTGMCPKHRKEKIELIKNDLNDKNKKIIVCSTQLIEAGVDLDFPVVFRALAPLDSIIQSAGRCNREGKRENLGKVFIFKLLEQKYPDESYEIPSCETERFLKTNDQTILHDHDSYTNYFVLLEHRIELDKLKIDEARSKKQFNEVSKHYKIIDKETKTIIVKYGTGTELVEELEKKIFLTKDDYRKLQLYSIQLYQNQFEESLCLGLIKKLSNGLFTWIGEYKEDVGILYERDYVV